MIQNNLQIYIIYITDFKLNNKYQKLNLTIIYLCKLISTYLCSIYYNSFFNFFIFLLINTWNIIKKKPGNGENSNGNSQGKI